MEEHYVRQQGEFTARRRQEKEPAVCSIVLTAVNVIVFFLCIPSAWGEFFYDEGSFSVLYLITNHEYYRLVTSMFLHADMEHLLNNMLLLYLCGEIVEKSIGKVRFLLLFFVSGICGNLLSAAYEVMTGSYYNSIGASGAVFGLVGGLLFLVLVRRGKAVQISIQRMVLMVVFSLYSGFNSAQVNNAAHVGGLISGFLLAFLLCLTLKEKKAGNTETFGAWQE